MHFFKIIHESHSFVNACCISQKEGVIANAIGKHSTHCCGQANYGRVQILVLTQLYFFCILCFSDHDETAWEMSTAIGSLLFACPHINNWILLSSNMDAAMVMHNVHATKDMSYMVTFQFFMTFFLSQCILFPMLQERGLVASIGAHATWNALAFTMHFHFPIWLVVQTWNWL